MSTDDEPLLTGEQHRALMDELFARWNAADPDSHKCFCGSDRDLIDAVTEMRARDDRELGDDR